MPSQIDPVIRGVQDLLTQYKLSGPNFEETPERVAKLWCEFFNKERPNMKVFPTNNNLMVVVKDFTTWGYCPHHLLPIRYTFKIGYIPNGQAVGLSKLPRLAEYYVSKLPIQEDLPNWIVEDLQQTLRPLGCGCQVKGFHLCCAARGVEADLEFVTTGLRGVFRHNPAAQQEFLIS